MRAQDEGVARAVGRATLAGASVAGVLALWGMPTVEVTAVPSRARAVPALHGPDPDLYEAVQLVGAYAGHGVIVCDVGHRVPSGPVPDLAHAHVRHGVLTATVSEPSGVAVVRGASDPVRGNARAVIRWSDAWAREEGACRVETPIPVPIDGWVVHADGRPLMRGSVRTPLGEGITDDTGAFHGQCWRDVPCPVQVRVEVGESWQSVAEWTPDGPLYAQTLALEPPRGEADEVAALKAQVAATQARSRMPDPLDAALDDGRLTPAAQRWVYRWRAAARLDEARTAGLLELASR